MWDFEQIKQMVNQAKIFSRPGLSGKIHYKWGKNIYSFCATPLHTFLSDAMHMDIL